MDDLEGRVTQLVATVKREAGLRASMDKDLGDISAKLGAQQRSLNALASVQSDHTRSFTRVESKLVRMELRLDGVEDKLDSVEGRFGDVDGRLRNVESRVDTMAGDLAAVKTGVHKIYELLTASPGNN